MKLVFKLNAAQAARAHTLVAKNTADISASIADAIKHNYSMSLDSAGNLHSIYLDNCVTNSDQYLHYDAQARTLTYEGQRCPFLADGAVGTVMEVLAVTRQATNYEDFVPSRYETSDTRLQWYETLFDYMANRATLPEKAAAMLAGIPKWGLLPIAQMEKRLGIPLSRNIKALYASYPAKTAGLLAALVEQSAQQWEGMTCV